MRRLCLVVMFTAFVLPCARAWAHGVVGDYIFLEPLIAEDPTPANELDIVQPSWVRGADGRTFTLATSIEKVIGNGNQSDAWVPRWSVGAGSSWLYQSPKEGANQSGFDDLNLFLKYAFLVLPEHEFLLGAMVNLQLPTGDPAVQTQNHTSLGPELVWEKALGDLPDWAALEYLRPLGFQGDCGYLPALSGSTSHLLFADQVVEYSLPYLSNSVRDIGLPEPLRDMFLFTEFNYSQLVAGPARQTFPNLLATPGIAYVSYYFELSLGTQFALNRASVPGTHAAFIGLLDIFYDAIFPQANWALFGGK
ncbi:MAG TPA: hypothetical protein VKV28_13840 [Candidatus Binataceae bacterium]|nr:hypothetical protein [Candidatus Binataceae bacterium]